MGCLCLQAKLLLVNRSGLSLPWKSGLVKQAIRISLIGLGGGVIFMKHILSVMTS